MPFDSLTLTGLCTELNEKLTQARIHKIYQPRRDEITLVLRPREGSAIHLSISANAVNARIHISEVHPENPKQAPAFCMLLRKYLEGARVESIAQDGLDRVLQIHMLALNDFREWEAKTLICEFMGKHSNILLVNPADGHIIDAIRRYSHEVSTYREVLPGKTYIAPPPQEKHDVREISAEDFSRLAWNLENPETLSNAAFQVLSGMSPAAAVHFCRACRLEPDMPAEECGAYEFRLLHQTILQTVQKLTAAGQHTGYLLRVNGSYKDFAAYPLFPAKGEVKVIETESISAAATRFYAQKEENLQIEQLRQSMSRRLKAQLDKLCRKQHFQNGDKAQAIRNEKYKTWGELLTAYAWQFKKGDTEAVLADFYTGENVTIQLDRRYTPIENAQHFFKIYNKSRGTLLHLETLMAENQQEIDYLQNALLAMEQAESVRELSEIRLEMEKQGYLKAPAEKSRKPVREQKLPPRRFLSSDGLPILVGRNSVQNDWLVRHAASSDLWLHTKEIASSHIILPLPREITSIDEVPDSTLLEAAMLCAYYSQGRSGNKVPVDYTFIRNVKKPAGAKPGLVIYENCWTILVDPNSDAMAAILARRQDNAE